MLQARKVNSFKEFKQEYFDAKEFIIEGNNDKLMSFYNEGVRLNFIKEQKDIKFPITLSGSRIIHFKLSNE